VLFLDRIKMMKKLFIVTLLILACSPFALAQNPLLDLAKQMPAKTWHEIWINGITKDLILPGTIPEQGFSYSSNGLWDHARNLGYFWSGEHATDYQCYYGVTAFTYAGTAAAGTASYSKVPQDS